MEKMMAIVAGPMAEHLLSRRQYRLEGGDYEMALDIVSEFDNGFTFRAGLARSKLYHEAKQRAHDFVVEHRKPILLLATVLCEFKILGAAAIDEVMATPIPEVS
jgi:hypothetical protein